ncbi:MAG TPA: glucokinase [Burkholderiaceae bacterium]
MAASQEHRLLADIQPEHVQFAIENEPGLFEQKRTLNCDEYPDFVSALQAYLSQVTPEVVRRSVRHGAIAIAYPVAGDLVRMTNYPWEFSIEATRAAVGFDTLLVVNDFTATAMALPELAPDERRQVGGGRPRERSVIGLVGSGTGLGVSALVAVDDGWVSLASEGGHVSFAPKNEHEVHVLEYAWRQFSHVSAERLLSGPGLELIHAALTSRTGRPVTKLSAEEITRRAVAGECAICTQTLQVFCEMLGTMAANVAITLGAYGGIYIGGAIVPRLGEYFDRSGFRARFESKGRLSELVAGIPTYVVTTETATLQGASAILNAQIKRRTGSSTLLERVRLARPTLTAAERRVAELVLAQARNVVNDPIMDIAQRAGVSQPTVVRFCRSLGCAGLSDFKLKLSAGLTGTIPLSHTQVRRSDSSLELGAKVLDNTAAAMLMMRDQINGTTIQRCVDCLRGAHRVDCYALPHFGAIAAEAQYKLMRLGVPAAAYVDTQLQPLAAGMLRPGDVVLAISGTAAVPALLEAVDLALERGATVIALAPGHSPLAKRATLTIAIDHPEDITTQIPMISRILHLAVIDILAVGLAMSSGAGQVAAAKADGDAAGTTRKPSTDLARLTSHSR